QASEETNHVYVTFCYALTLYRRGQRGDFDEALRVLKNKPGSYNDCLIPFVLAEHDYRSAKHDWQARALQASNEYAEQGQNGHARILPQAVLYLLGRKEDAVKAARKLQKEPELISKLRQEPILRCVDYNAGALPEDKLIQAANGSQWDQCRAHYY